ncbi:SPE_1075/MLC_0560 family membrane protein [Spiroplasma culicicola]|uniref:Transmembrane protein n=1 Tax=Spiroplasma culicicola AES-1 TaxID=1276246 RepID=W6A8M7_9MOLU|nr:hypothetical protein [Spiroplasma culicicola]AHI53372.1 transmembrane protein [Spiroplasma culicicola AES-1]
MKLYYEQMKENVKLRWRSLLVRFFLFIFGFAISTLGIAFYTTTKIGASQMDFTIYVISAMIDGYDMSNGSMTSEVIQGIYILIYNLILALFVILSIAFSLPKIIKDLKEKNSVSTIQMTINLICDIIIVFLAPLLMQLYLKQVVAVEQIMSESTSQNIRNLIFIGGFVMFCIGVAMWVHANMSLGPYNSYASSFQNLTGLNYAISRVLMDLLIFVPGLILFPFIPGDWNQKTQFLLTNLGIGTIAFTFLTGPFVNLIIKGLKKIFDWDKIDKINA